MILAGIPAHNEERVIASVILQAHQYVDKVLVINDGSTDNTEKVSKLAGADVLNHPVNYGYGRAIKSLLEAARKMDAEMLVILDSDGQHNPNEIPLLIKEIQKGYDLVIGTRRYCKESTPGYRWVGQKVLTAFTNITLKQKFTDTECGFRAYSKIAVNKLNLKENGMAISAEIVIQASWLGLNIKEIPVSVSYENIKHSNNPIKHGVGNLIKIIIMIRTR